MAGRAAAAGRQQRAAAGECGVGSSEAWRGGQHWRRTRQAAASGCRRAWRGQQRGLAWSGCGGAA